MNHFLHDHQHRQNASTAPGAGHGGGPMPVTQSIIALIQSHEKQHVEHQKTKKEEDAKLRREHRRRKEEDDEDDDGDDNNGDDDGNDGNYEDSKYKSVMMQAKILGKTYYLSCVDEIDFRHYACVKAYDVISGGKYKAQLSKGKAVRDLWAIEAYATINAIGNNVKLVNAVKDKLKNLPHSPMHRLCFNTLVNSNPPVRICDTIATCCITGIRGEGYVDLSPGSNKMGNNK